jgi:hypothetical protein
MNAPEAALAQAAFVSYKVRTCCVCMCLHDEAQVAGWLQNGHSTQISIHSSEEWPGWLFEMH